MENLLGRGISKLSESLVSPVDSTLTADALTLLVKHEEQEKKKRAVLLELAKELDTVMDAEAPYIFETTDGQKTWTREVSRDELLEHQICVAIDTITDLMEDE